LKNRFQRVTTDNRPRQYFSKWEPVCDCDPQGSVLLPLAFFKLNINYLPQSTSDTSNPILFADDTSMTITGSDPHEFWYTVNNSIININSWFITNLLSLNIDKTQFLQFLMKNSKMTDLSISYKKKHIMKVKLVWFNNRQLSVMELPY
jgi:hypothetical protein